MALERMEIIRHDNNNDEINILNRFIPKDAFAELICGSPHNS